MLSDITSLFSSLVSDRHWLVHQRAFESVKAFAEVFCRKNCNPRAQLGVGSPAGRKPGRKRTHIFALVDCSQPLYSSTHTKQKASAKHEGVVAVRRAKQAKRRLSLLFWAGIQYSRIKIRAKERAVNSLSLWGLHFSPSFLPSSHHSRVKLIQLNSFLFRTAYLEEL